MRFWLMLMRVRGRRGDGRLIGEEERRGELGAMRGVRGSGVNGVMDGDTGG